LEKTFSPDWCLQKRLVAPHDFEEMGFTFLVHTTLDEENIRATCEAVEKVMSAATRAAALAIRLSPIM
jgi:hypothetical protein